jgi:hypothetical protein
MGTWCSWLSRSLSTTARLGEVSGSIPDVSTFAGIGLVPFFFLLPTTVRVYVRWMIQVCIQDVKIVGGRAQFTRDEYITPAHRVL